MLEHDSSASACCTCATVFSRACTHLLPGGHAIYKLLDVNAVVRTGRIFCSGASNSSAPSVPASDKPFSFVATEAQLDGFTSNVTDMALAVPTLHRSLRVRCFDPRDFWALKDTSRARPEIDISPTERSRSIHRENDEETLLRPPQAVTSACHIFFDLFSDIGWPSVGFRDLSGRWDYDVI